MTSGSWSAYDAGSTSGLNTKGFNGGVFDGRYVYFVPNINSSGYDGIVLRFDTTGKRFHEFDELVGLRRWQHQRLGYYRLRRRRVRWTLCLFRAEFQRLRLQRHRVSVRHDRQFHDRGELVGCYDRKAALSGLNTKGFSGSVFDGRYVYFVPNANNISGYIGFVLRFDTTGNFTSASSWSAICGNTDGRIPPATVARFPDGRYFYFAPEYNSAGPNSVVMLRFDAKLPLAPFRLNGQRRLEFLGLEH